MISVVKNETGRTKALGSNFTTRTSREMVGKLTNKKKSDESTMPDV
jgi:hypothetical protein